METMDDSGIFRRTQAGQSALDARDKRLTPRLRALMLMAEGKPIAQVADIAQALGAPIDALERIFALRFFDLAATAPAGAADAAPQASVPAGTFERYRAASGMVREIAADTLGLRGFFFMLKVERCATLDELESLLPELMRSLAKQKGDKNAALLEAQLRAMFRHENNE